MSKPDRIVDLDSLDSSLAARAMKGLWARGERYHAEPTPFGEAMVWKWADVRAGLEAASRFVPTNFRGSRRVIKLVHPSLGEATSHTLLFAVQLVKAGEAVYAHRHTASAMRFVLEGGTDVYTITDGEKCVMERGDLVIQPNWGWHNHVNESEKDAVWIDCLDVGVMSMLRTMFQEPHPAEELKLYNSTTDNAIRNPGSMAPPARTPKRLVYKWRETLTALEEMLPMDKSPHDGRCLEYRNPVDGGATFATFSCWMQMLEPGEETAPHRHTANHLCHAFQGGGVTEVEGKELAWDEGDFFVIPNWTWHRHRNTSDTPSIVFSTTDRPLLEKLGLYREQEG